MVYYRTWRDQSIPSEQNNQIRMTDIPYGIDVVNVFHANVSDADSKVFLMKSPMFMDQNYTSEEQSLYED